MKAKGHVAFGAEKHNSHQLVNAGDQTTHQVYPIDAYLQSEGLSSKETGTHQTGETLLPLDLSKFPDGTQVLQVGPPLIIDIPDSYIEAVRNSRGGADRQLPCNQVEEGLATYRKSQSAFLIGKSKLDDI